MPARNNVVLVTSALPGEGKTFTSLNLALSIVRDREMRVVLVDGDVARPGLTPALGLEGRPGLNDALEDDEPRHQYGHLPDRRRRPVLRAGRQLEPARAGISSPAAACRS